MGVAVPESHVHHGDLARRAQMPLHKGCGRGLRGFSRPKASSQVRAKYWGVSSCSWDSGFQTAHETCRPSRRPRGAAAPSPAPGERAPPSSPRSLRARPAPRAQGPVALQATPVLMQSKLRGLDPPPPAPRKARAASDQLLLWRDPPAPPHTHTFSCVLKICCYEEF